MMKRLWSIARYVVTGMLLLGTSIALTGTAIDRHSYIWGIAALVAVACTATIFCAFVAGVFDK